MADGFLIDLLKSVSKEDEEARETLKVIKRKLDGLNMSPKKKDYRCETCDKEFDKKKTTKDM